MVRPERVRRVGGGEALGSGPVVYWMNRDCRVLDNWAYQHAAEEARAAEVPLLVVYHLAPRFLGGGFRQHAFKVRGLMEVEQMCARLETPFFLSTEPVATFAVEYDARLVVTDYSPLRIHKTWVADASATLSCPLYQVDAHNIVPCWVTSPKQEYAARTIRPKLARLAPDYLEPFEALTVHPFAYTEAPASTHWEKILAMVPCTKDDSEVSWITPGCEAGMHTLAAFVTERLERYATARNNPNTNGQSKLSPYLHYGHIAPARVAIAACESYAKERRLKRNSPQEVLALLMDPRRNGSGEMGGSYESFIEELIVRRELADNFCEYNAQYDAVDGFPSWARITLDAHRSDARAYVYTYEMLEKALTHDELWNAAQQQLLREGTMHGYLRMYWGKKILEWSVSPEDALANAIRLNDRYQLDGRDPNGYTGIAWCIGGVHDRPWFTREIFGTVRYMARSGCEKKFDVREYIKRYA